jgi:hypothetical protein
MINVPHHVLPPFLPSRLLTTTYHVEVTVVPGFRIKQEWLLKGNSSKYYKAQNLAHKALMLSTSA